MNVVTFGGGIYRRCVHPFARTDDVEYHADVPVVGDIVQRDRDAEGVVGVIGGVEAVATDEFVGAPPAAERVVARATVDLIDAEGFGEEEVVAAATEEGVGAAGGAVDGVVPAATVGQERRDGVAGGITEED